MSYLFYHVLKRLNDGLHCATLSCHVWNTSQAKKGESHVSVQPPITTLFKTGRTTQIMFSHLLVEYWRLQQCYRDKTVLLPCGQPLLVTGNAHSLHSVGTPTSTLV
jgi:hypothetical protein